MKLFYINLNFIDLLQVVIFALIVKCLVLNQLLFVIWLIHNGIIKIKDFLENMTPVFMVPMFNEIILCKSQYFIFKPRDYAVKCRNCPIGFPNCVKNLNFECFNCKLHHMGRFVILKNYVLF